MIEYTLLNGRRILIDPKFVTATIDDVRGGTSIYVVGAEESFHLDEHYDKVAAELKKAEVNNYVLSDRKPLTEKDFVSINGTEYRISYQESPNTIGLVDGYYVYLNSNMELTTDGEVKLALEGVKGVSSINTYGGKYTITLVVGLLFDADLVCKDIEELLRKNF